MENNVTYIYRSNGFYLGFIKNNYLFSRDGVCLGWIEGDLVWDSTGRFRGLIVTFNGHKYILVKRFLIPPVSRAPKPLPVPVMPPSSPPNISAISLPVEYSDAF